MNRKGTESNRYYNGAGARRPAGKRRVLIVLIIVCASVFAVSAYMLINYYWTGHEAEKAFDELRLPDDAFTDPSYDTGDTGVLGNPIDPDLYAIRQAHYLDLYKQNRDFVGWLRVRGTDVDYPVMQTPNDRDYYLHRTFDKTYRAAGTIFASDISDVDKPSDIIILFGHMMKNGSMFGGLKKFTSKDYMEQHRIIRFDTLKEERIYQIFCVFTQSVNTGKASEFKYYQASDFKNAADYDAFLAQAASKALYDTGETAAYGDELLALSTCEYTHADGRLVLLAKRFEPGGTK
jgi:sortase B